MAAAQEYQVTARKWRPYEFASVVGQEHVTQTLKNAIRQGRLHHAYLFSGPRGVGKTTTARILAKALNCRNMGEDLEPCGVCDSCREITEGRSLDVVEIDGASNNSVEDIRKLRDNAKYPPVGGGYKLYIIDEVHMLSTSAFNALLKTLEEPPRHLVFVFATTEPHKVPATILSRCQRFDFRRMQISDIVGRLSFIAQQEGMEIEEDALVVIAKKGDGSMRDSQSIFDQVTSFCGMKVSYAQANEALNIIDQGFFFRVTDMMRSGATSEAFAIVEEIMRIGYDVQEFLIGLAEHLRNFLTVLTTSSTRLVETAKMYMDRYAAEAREMEEGDMIRALHLTLAAQGAIRSSSQPRLRLELVLLQLAVMDSTLSLTQLLEKIDRMPDAPAGGALPAAAPAPAAQPAAVPAAAPAAAPAPEPKSGYAAALKEQFGGEGRASSLQDLQSFPTTAPPPPPGRGSSHTSDRPSSGSPRGNAPSGGGPGEEPPGYRSPTDGAPQGGLSDRDLQRRWNEFLNYCDDKKSLTMALDSRQPPELYGGNTVRLYVSNDLNLTLLNRNKEVLREKLESFFKIPLNVEGVIGNAPVPVGGDSSSSAPYAKSDHPFVQGLVDLLEASPI